MAEYEVITVSGWETFDVFADFGGRCERVLFDQTAPGAIAHLSAQSASDWVVRDVGWLGVGDAYVDRQLLKVGCFDPGTAGLVERVYLGDGTAAGSSNNGILVDGDHAGTITIRDTHVGYCADNGIYASNGGPDGHTEIEGCYGENNNIAAFRIGSPHSYVRDSVAVVTAKSDVPDDDGREGRGVRMHYTDENLVENCEIRTVPDWRAVQAKDGGGGTVRNSRIEGRIDDREGPIYLENVGGDPDSRLPADVPRTPVEAAAGLSDVHPIPVAGETSLAAADALTSAGTHVRTVHAGYTGVGFLDLEPPDGAWAGWDLDVRTPGTYDVEISFSNGDGERVGELRIGGASEEVAFPPTGGWDRWETTTLSRDLPGGRTRLEIAATGEDTGHVDCVRLAPADESAA